MSSNPAIRFLVETFSSETDTNGNRSHFAIVTSTKTGKRLVISDTTASNARSLVQSATGLFGYPAVMNNEVTLPKREWQRANKANPGTYEGAVDLEDVRKLELSDELLEAMKRNGL